MSKPISICCARIAMMFASLSLGGCTVIGYGIGWVVDDSAEYTVSSPPSDAIEDLWPYLDDITLVMKDSSRVQGLFRDAFWAQGKLRPRKRSMVILPPEAVEKLSTSGIYGIEVETDSSIVIVDASEVQSILCRKKPNAGRWGLSMLGLMIDGFIIYSIASMDFSLNLQLGDK